MSMLLKALKDTGDILLFKCVFCAKKERPDIESFIGLRNARLNYCQYDPGHIMENIIYMDLIRRGYSVDVGAVTERKNGEKTAREIDFVVNDGDCHIYFQSAYQIDDEQKADAELRLLKPTGDFFKNRYPYGYTSRVL